MQIAVRALDYGKFYGAGSTQLGAQLQFGVLLPSGNYGWKNLALVASGTEQYYTIPVSECPVDASGRYQVVLRAVEPQQNKAALVAYTNIKLNGLQIANLGDMGDSTIMYFENGIKISPVYYLNGTINGVTYSATTDTGEMDDVQFWDGKVSLTLDSAAVITIRRDMLKDTLVLFTSDHGDMMGNHSLWGKNSCLYNDVIHIPLVVHHPGQTERKDIAERVSSLEVMPTLLDMGGAEIPAGIDGRLIDDVVAAGGRDYVISSVEGRVAVVCGVEQLHGAQVDATDLRGGAALVVAGLQAQGTTRVGDIHHIRRGYADIVGDLTRLGATIWEDT